MSLAFKTSVRDQALFMIDSTRGGHDRHIWMQHGRIYSRIWKGGRYQVSKGATSYADNKWHHVEITCKNGQRCTSKIDGKPGNNAPIDHSDFDWADRINLGWSFDYRKRFTGMMRNVVYKALPQ